MNEKSRQSLQSVPEKNVRIRNIPRELDAIWAGLHQQLTEDQVVTRACMSNLIIYCDDDDQTRDIRRILPDIVTPHPSRVILLTGLGYTSEPGLDVFVSGLYSNLPGGVQVSAELIRVVADSTARKRLAPVARAQLVGDLPTTLWWASHQPAPFLSDVFNPLTAHVDQIIYDSFGWSEPTKGMHAMSRWVAAQSAEYVIDNMAWRRLKHWRSLLSQVLDPAVLPGALAGISRLKIEHGPHAVAMTALLVGWLASLLGWQVKGGKTVPGKQTVWQFGVSGRQFTVTLTRVEQAPSAPVRIEWSWRGSASDQRIVFADLGDNRLGLIEADSNLPARVVSALPATQGTMVAAQMAHRSRDRVFERALDSGNSMIAVLLK
ncbi:MAG: glucose-6-phosphate dehydrogenase assembly protein OpcA [Gammaproteobacteria bacterium]|nr:glucose-6-phosphate dehydrogenase assembly protein OpcA [Gammaproteobacteria bacterium]